MCLCLALPFLSLSHGSKSDDNVNANWMKLSQWINSNGGYVDPKIKANMTSHSGIRIRGIVSEKALDSGETILHIPKKLWFTLDRYPDIHDVSLARVSQCSSSLKDSDRALVKVAGALAREHKKGNASFFHPYISRLPTLDEFRSFHPRFMKADVREDFNGLPMTAIAVELQKFDAKLRDCFLAWTRSPGSPVAGISLELFELGYTHFRTRAFGTNSAFPSLVPGADLLNTDKPYNLNTFWQKTDDNFLMHGSSGGVESGRELYDEYCKPCDNTILMSLWGLYLEGNENPLTRLADCNAKRDPGQLYRHGKFRSLREASEAMLDLNDIDPALKEGRKAPRCHKESFSLEQGPLRCSFARLAFEHCVQEWGYLGSRVPEVAFVSRPRFNATGIAHLIRSSYIHAVHPKLWSSSRNVRKNLRKGRQDLIITHSSASVS